MTQTKWFFADESQDSKDFKLHRFVGVQVHVCSEIE